MPCLCRRLSSIAYMYNDDAAAAAGRRRALLFSRAPASFPLFFPSEGHTS